MPAGDQPQQHPAWPGESEVVEAFELLLTAIAEERRRIQAVSAAARDRESFDSSVARVNALFELEKNAQALQAAYAGSAVTLSPSPSPGPAEAVTHPPDQRPASARRSRKTELRHTLAELADGQTANSRATGGKPTLVHFPDGSSAEVRHWNDVPVRVAEWLSIRRGIPIPFAGRTYSKQWFIHSEPCHPDGTPFELAARRHVRTTRQEFWLDTHRNARDLLETVPRIW